MRIFYFDDSGNKVSTGQGNRFFCLGGFSIDAQDLPLLKHHRDVMWKKHPGLGLPNDEMKFAHVASERDRPGKSNPLVRVGMDLDSRRRFVLEALQGLVSIKSLEIVAGLVDKPSAYGKPHFVHAMTVLMERSQMSLSEKSDFGIMFCDEENRNQTPLRDVLTQGSTDYVKLTHIKETVAFVPSHLSPGVQFADLVAGAISRAANSGDWGYMNIILPAVRRSSTGAWDRHGIKIYPRGNFPKKNEAEFSSGNGSG